MSFNSNSTQLLWSELNQTHELNELTLQLILFKKDPKYCNNSYMVHQNPLNAPLSLTLFSSRSAPKSLNNREWLIGLDR